MVFSVSGLFRNNFPWSDWNGFLMLRLLLGLAGLAADYSVLYTLAE